MLYTTPDASMGEVALQCFSLELSYNIHVSQLLWMKTYSYMYYSVIG